MDIDLLKKENYKAVGYRISDYLRDKSESNNLSVSVTYLAYLLYASKNIEKFDEHSLNEFIGKFNLDELLVNILNDLAFKHRDFILKTRDCFSTEELKAVILFNEIPFRYAIDESTPEGIRELAVKILDIKNDDRVLDLCSGKGNFIFSAYENNSNAKYLGVELNFDAKYISELRASVVGGDIRFILDNALSFDSSVKADKIFSNYPFSYRGWELDKYKEQFQNILGINPEIIRRCSSDWIFNAAMLSHMSENGKAVALMTNGSTWNVPDRNIRRYFIENGFIEAVISLPAKLFDYMSIAVTMIVFSRNNKAVKMIDAGDIFKKENRVNVLDEECIEEIISLYKTGSGSKAVTIDNSKFSENEYTLNASRYLETVPEFSDGAEFGSVIRSITRGAQLKASEFEELKTDEPTNYRYLTLANINDGIISFDEEQYIKEIADNLKKYCIKNNSIVLAKIGNPTFKSAVAQVEDNCEILANGNLFIIELDETKADPFYVQAFFSSEAGTATFRRIYTGVVMQTISIDKLKKMIIPLPPLEKQKAIGEKYAANMDEIVLLKNRLEKATIRMKHIFDEEE